MRLSGLLLSTLALVALGEARDFRHLGRRSLTEKRGGDPMRPSDNAGTKKTKRANYLIPQNANTTKFAVNGAAIPDVDFDIGESYAGLLPISEKADEPNKMYFWFFPSPNEKATNDITIWLNGGPGCSSLIGLLKEHGPMLWPTGTFKPVENPWTWVKLTSMLYVEQPVGTGFSQQSKPAATSEEEVAAQFLGFFKNFVDTFGLHGKKIYITGESYAGLYVSFIADAMLNKNDKTYYDLSSIMLYDALINNEALFRQVPAVAFVDYWAPLFNFNETFTASIHSRAKSCGYTSYLDENLVFPPKGKLPDPPDGGPDCDLWYDIADAVSYTNPCFNYYHVSDTCPVQWDVLGFPGAYKYTPEGAQVYFNRSDVQRAINAPVQNWAVCSDGVLDKDTSAEPSWEVLPRVLERAERVIIAHGMLDFVLISQGSLLSIQNMTWKGAQGFQSKPSEPFFVPYVVDESLTSLSANGIMGTMHTERGLTWIEMALTGHEVPAYQPGAAYHQLEFLLGRISSLGVGSEFSTPVGSSGGGPNLRGQKIASSACRTLGSRQAHPGECTGPH